MKIRLFAILALAGLMFGIASAGDRKKVDQAPETPPQLPSDLTPPPIVQASHPSIIAPPRIVPAGPSRLPIARFHDEQNSQHFRDVLATPDTRGRQILKTFPVADLVVPMPALGTLGKPLTEKIKTLEADLIKKIISTVEPDSWSALGGQGTIEYFPIGMALIVNNTPTVQAAIEKYLDALWRIQDQQVVTELRLVTVSDAWFEKSGLSASFCPGECPKSGSPKVKMLTRDEAGKLVRLAQEDAGTTMMASPRITTLSGQPGRVRVGQTEHYLTELKLSVVNGQVVYIPKNEPHELGLDLTIEPTVSADGKYIRVGVTGSSRELGINPVPLIPITIPVQSVAQEGKKGESIPFTHYIQEPRIISRSVAETITMPDGGTALLYGGKATIEETVKDRAPMLADVPVLSELFTRERKTTSTNHLLVMVRSRIVKPEIVDEECEACCAMCDSKLGKLMADYAKACKTGKAEDARRLAMECLVIDPTCFGKK